MNPVETLRANPGYAVRRADAKAPDLLPRLYEYVKAAAVPIVDGMTTDDLDDVADEMIRRVRREFINSRIEADRQMASVTGTSVCINLITDLVAAWIVEQTS